MRNIKNKKAVSPVIATVILVAVAITIAVAVAFWIGGITSQYTRFEKVEITSSYTVADVTFWNTTMTLKNTGTTPATITDALINGKSYLDYGSGNMAVFISEDSGTTWSALPVDVGFSVQSGASVKVRVDITKAPTPSNAYAFTPGTTIEATLHTGAGNNYMKMVTLV